MNRLYSVGAYIRLSVEDSISDSDSLENQREMLSLFIDRMPGWIAHRFYIDNGVSGGTFDRPAFQEMMTDVRNGLINLIIVKDMSRWGRNYIEAGRYLEEELPALGCRFVALADGVDTESGENDIVPFLNMLNDFYLRNLSDRIKSVLHAKARDGQKIGGHAPYGYIRNPEDHTRLIVDEYAANVVRRIFEMRRQETGYPSIVRALNHDGILPPKLYYATKAGLNTSNIRFRQWIVNGVSALLRNESYTGTAVQLKNKIISHRDKREVRRPEDEWVRVENAFPAIINRETWDAVQAVNRRAKERCPGRRQPRKSLFSGLLVCGGCGSSLVYRNDSRRDSNGNRIEFGSYSCSAYLSTCGACCSKHHVYESTLKDLVLGQVRQLAAQIKLDEDAMLRSLHSQLIGSEKISKSQSADECKLLRKRLRELDAMTMQLYEDRVTGSISEDDFAATLGKNEAKRREKEQRLTLLEQSEGEVAAKLADVQHWMRLIREKALLDDVDRGLLETLVEHIEIGEREVVGGKKRQDIQIIYRFVGLV